VSDSQGPPLLPSAIPASRDEQASSPSPPSRPSTLRRMRSIWPPGDEQSSSASGRSIPSTIRRMQRDFRESQVTTVVSTTNTILVNRNLYELKCPICDQDLNGWSEEMRITHVNSCLDGSEHVDHVPSSPSITETPVLTAASGSWVCKKCMSEVVESLKTDICGTCGSRRTHNDPSSLNGFETIDHYQILQIPLLNLNSLRALDGSMARYKVVLLGDACCGKTWLARYVKNRFCRDKR
jgi:hypothetical protein